MSTTAAFPVTAVKHVLAELHAALVARIKAIVGAETHTTFDSQRE